MVAVLTTTAVGRYRAAIVQDPAAAIVPLSTHVPPARYVNGAPSAILPVVRVVEIVPVTPPVLLIVKV